MKVSEAISKLSAIMSQFGDIEIVGGYLSDCRPPAEIMVVDDNGCEVYPNNLNGTMIDFKDPSLGVFIE